MGQKLLPHFTPGLQVDAEGTLGEVTLNEGKPPPFHPKAGPEGVLEGDPRAQGTLGEKAHGVAPLPLLKGNGAAVSQEGGELPLRPGTHALGKVKDPGDEASASTAPTYQAPSR